MRQQIINADSTTFPIPFFDLLHYDPPFSMHGAYDHIPRPRHPCLAIIWSDVFSQCDAVIAAHLKGWSAVSFGIWDCCTSIFVKNAPLVRHKIWMLFSNGGKKYCAKSGKYFNPNARKMSRKTVKNSRGSYEYIPDKDGLSTLSTVFVKPITSMDKRHVHEKPIELIRALIKGCQATSIYDPFAGSGVVGEVAIELGLEYTGVEINVETFVAARKNLIRKKVSEIKRKGNQVPCQTL